MNQFTRLKSLELSDKEDPYLWSIDNMEKLYSVCDKRDRKAIEKDQEIRAENVVCMMMTHKYQKLVLLDGDGRMLAKIIIAFKNKNIPLPSIKVVEIDQDRHEYHKAQFPNCVEKECGDILTSMDKDTFIYYNFCSIGGIFKKKDPSSFIQSLSKTNHFMIGYTVQGTKRKAKFSKKQKTPMKSALRDLKKMTTLISNRKFYQTFISKH
jgi:hypothetical protein